jgi:hypothetical protein
MDLVNFCHDSPNNFKGYIYINADIDVSISSDAFLANSV